MIFETLYNCDARFDTTVYLYSTYFKVCEIEQIIQGAEQSSKQEPGHPGENKIFWGWDQQSVRHTIPKIGYPIGYEGRKRISKL